MPYYTCPRCRLSYYSAASWAYVPECPRCYQPLNRPSHVRDRVVSIARRTRREGRDTEPPDGNGQEMTAAQVQAGLEATEAAREWDLHPSAPTGPKSG